MNTETFTHPKDILKMDSQQLLDRVKGKTAIFTHNERTVRGEIVGGIMNPMHHYYIFKAFHVIIPTGEKLTVNAGLVTIK